MSCVIGIDPGATGAVAVFYGGKLDEVFDLPTYGGRIDGGELAEQLANYSEATVYVENTHPMPHNGSIASFKLGLNTGIIIGVVQSLRYPLVRVTAGDWKRRNGLIGKPKDAARGLASELWPAHASMFRRVKDHNRAEAALIGRFGIFRAIHNAQTPEDHDGIAEVSDLRREREHHPSGGIDRGGAVPPHRAEPSLPQ